MGRPLSPTMQSIFAGRGHKIDWTLDISFPNATAFHFATRPLSIGATNYTNDLESVGDLQLSLEGPIDRVRFAMQNQDRVLGLHVAEHWRKWRRAEVVAGRLYRGGDNFELSEWRPMFLGAVQAPNANDQQVYFDAIPDTVSPGGIVAIRTLDGRCWYIYKDPKTCGHTGPEGSCDQHLKSANGCDAKNNSHRYGGMEHRYNTEQYAPGTPVNPGGPIGGGRPPCPRLDQFVLVKGENGLPLQLQVAFLTTEHELFNPITRTFHEVESAEVVRNEDIWEMITYTGAIGFSSSKHPILWHKSHTTGEAIERFTTLDPVLAWRDGRLVNTRCAIARDTCEKGDVMRIHMKDGHIYCYGDSSESGKYIVCHNMKALPPDIDARMVQ